MAEHRITMTGESIQAILEGRKTQTRRLVTRASVKILGKRPTPKQWDRIDLLKARTCPGHEAALALMGNHIKPYTEIVPAIMLGDTLAITETHAIVPATAYRMSREEDGSTVPHRTSPDGNDWAVYKHGWTRCEPRPWRSSRFMPSWANRLRLQVTRAHFEPLQTICEADVFAEGLQIPADREGHLLLAFGDKPFAAEYFPPMKCVPGGRWTLEHYARAYFAAGWDRMHAKRGHPWSANDWVTVITFELDANLSQETS